MQDECENQFGRTGVRHKKPYFQRTAAGQVDGVRVNSAAMALTQLGSSHDQWPGTVRVLRHPTPCVPAWSVH